MWIYTRTASNCALADLGTLSQSLASSPAPSLLRGPQQPPQQASSSQQLEPNLALTTPEMATANDPKDATHAHQAGQIQNAGDGQARQQDQHSSTRGVETPTSEAQQADHADDMRSTADGHRSGSAMSSARSGMSMPKEGEEEPPVKEEPPFNLELLLPYASLAQVSGLDRRHLFLVSPHRQK